MTASVIVAVAVMSAVVTRADARTPSADVSCAAESFAVMIGGGRACLGDHRACGPRFEPAYRRLGFVCEHRRLHFEWKTLERTHDTPMLPPGGPCPATPARPANALSRADGALVGIPVWAPGPVYPLIVQPLGFPTPALATLYFDPPPTGASWGGQKVAWFIDPGYQGPVLIRGRQLDGEHPVGFEDGQLGFSANGMRHPAAELRYWMAGSHPADTDLEAPGCYAYEIDGVGFSRTIVFRAVLDS